jgi:hypothetical protein
VFAAVGGLQNARAANRVAVKVSFAGSSVQMVRVPGVQDQ